MRITFSCWLLLRSIKRQRSISSGHQKKFGVDSPIDLSMIELVRFLSSSIKNDNLFILKAASLYRYFYLHTRYTNCVFSFFPLPSLKIVCFFYKTKWLYFQSTIKKCAQTGPDADADTQFRLYDGVPELMAPPILMRIAALWASTRLLFFFSGCEPLFFHLWIRARKRENRDFDNVPSEHHLILHPTALKRKPTQPYRPSTIDIKDKLFDHLLAQFNRPHRQIVSRRQHDDKRQRQSSIFNIDLERL